MAVLYCTHKNFGNFGPRGREVTSKKTDNGDGDDYLFSSEALTAEDGVDCLELA